MRTRLLCALVVLFGCVGTVMAAEIVGVIYTVDGGKLTFREGKAGAELKTYAISKDVKVFRFAKKNKRVADPDGLKAEPLPNLPKGGTLAAIKVDNGKVTEITLPPKSKKN